MLNFKSLSLQAIFLGACKCYRETFQFITEGAFSWSQVSAESEELDSFWFIWLYSCVERYSRAGCVKMCYNEALFSLKSILQSLSIEKKYINYTSQCFVNTNIWSIAPYSLHTPHPPKSLLFSSSEVATLWYNQKRQLLISVICL